MARFATMKQMSPRVPLLLVLAAYAWRVQGLDNQSLWRDEVDAIFFAARYLPDTLSMFVRAGQNGPLYFLTLRPWFSLMGTSEFALRYPSAMAGVLCVPLLWQVARRLLPPRTMPAPAALEEKDNGKNIPTTPTQNGPEWAPLLAALFFALNPYQLWYGQEGKMYSVITLLVLATTWVWWMGISRGGWRPWLAYLVTASIALYTHLLIILLFPLHMLWFGIAWPQSKRHWRGYGLALAGLTLPYFPMVWWQWDMLTASQASTGFSFIPLPRMLNILLMNHSRGFMQTPALVWMAPLFFLGAAGILLGIGEIGTQRIGATGRLGIDLAGWRRYLLVLTWLLVPVLGIHILSLRQPIFTDRYVIWIAPAAMLFLALGVQAVRHYAVWPNFLAATLVLYVLAFWLFAGWQQKTLPMKYDLRSGVTYIEERRKPGTLLILQIPHMEYGYRYYSSNLGPRPFDGSEERLAPWAGGLWTNNGFPEDQARAQVDSEMRGMMADAQDVWVLRSEVEMWDQRHLMDEWLDTHGEVTERADFHGVQVRHYSLD